MYRFIAIVLLLAVQSASAVDFWAGSAYYLRGDFTAALREWRPLAEQGDAQAQFYLGIMHTNDEGVPEDDRQAVFWFRKSAEQGDARAQFNLGAMYEFGEGVPEDDRQAVIWYRQAAEQGHARAQFGLGLMYATGAGIPQDNVQAYAWFNLAAAGGDERVQQLATGRKTTLRQEMTATQIMEAQLLSGMIADRIDLAAGIDRPRPVLDSRSALPNDAQVQALSDRAPAVSPLQDTVQRSQIYLAALGFDPGPADGLIGKRTRTAVQNFQRQANLMPTGRITEELLRLLQAAVAEEQERQT